MIEPNRALYQVAAEEQGADVAKLTGTTQNDIIKEYLAPWCACSAARSPSSI
jgi:methylmalonyl-CoA mutase N-terminal domain/subunit